MSLSTDIIIIGGGLAGLTAAIHLCRQGIAVTLIEKNTYPEHRVCGEYVSNEVLPYLQWLGINVWKANAVAIDSLVFSGTSGKAVNAKLPLGGFGISRYTLDELLYKQAVANGCKVIISAVNAVTFDNDLFTVTASDNTYNARIVLGAFGKRSNMDHLLSRGFIQKKSPWLAVKAHYKGCFPDNVVALHNFSGGYCGISKVENDVINICYLADYVTFKKYKNTTDFQHNVLYGNRHLEAVFESNTMLFEKPLTISQVSFDRKEPVENHILMMGDTAGLIHPLCGNGMAMAIHSAKIAAELVSYFFSGIIATRQELEERYRLEWGRQFSKRLRMGRLLNNAMRNGAVSTALMQAVQLFPALLPIIIKQTHGKPLQLAS